MFPSLREPVQALCIATMNHPERLEELKSESHVLVFADAKVEVVKHFLESEKPIDPVDPCAVCGPAWMRNHQKIWSVFVSTHGNRSSLPEYYRDLITLALEGALASKYPGKIIVNLPLMAASDEEHRHFVLALQEQLRFVRYNHKLSVRLVVKPQHESAELIRLVRAVRITISQNGDLFHLPVTMRDDGTLNLDIFHRGLLKVKEVTELPPLQCIIVPWRKPVLGVRGSTLCDKFVSGLGEAAKLPNTSHLINPRVCPYLLDSDKWGRIER